MSAVDLALAAKAHKLSGCHGITGRELADLLKVKLASEAHHLAAVGRRLARVEAAKLSDPEMLLLLTLAEEERRLAARGEVRSSKGVDVSWRARKGGGWAAATAAKRLGSHRKGEEVGRPGTGLNLLHASRNGHMWMTRAGWALIHAHEAAIELARARGEA